MVDPIFKTGPVYEANLNAIAKIVINQGGTDSGKTYALVQIAFTICTTQRAPSEDPIFTILNESIPNSKKGAYRIAQGIFNNTPALQDMVESWNDSARTVYFKSGWILEFLGATDEQNAKQGKRQYLFVNEANGISWSIFWQMAKRTRIRVWMDYNPSAPFWAHENLIGTEPEGNDLYATVQLIISDHRHNPFLSHADHMSTEMIKDPELWKVYARGLTGNLMGIIYPNWRQIADKEFPWASDNFFGAIDFGYTNDPTAGVVLARVGDTIFAHELCYAPGIAAKDIKIIYRKHKFDEDRPIYCEHDPDMIRQLRMSGIMAIAARKGQGSIFAGISKVKEYNVLYTASSKNIENERKKYMFVKDKDTGRLLNTPNDTDNHLMDAIRYGVYSHYYRQE